MSKNGVVNPTLILLLLLVAIPSALALLSVSTGGVRPLRWAVPITLMTCAVLFATLAPRLVRAKRLSRLQGREPLSSEEFYSRFYSDSGLDEQSVTAAMKKVSDTLRLPAGLLRPSDQFGKEYRPPPGYEMDDEIVEIAWDLEEMCEKRRVPAAVLEKRQIVTLDDYIRTYCELLDIPEKGRGAHRRKGESV